MILLWRMRHLRSAGTRPAHPARWLTWRRSPGRGVHWYNIARLMHRLGRRPPAEAEAGYYCQQAGKGRRVSAARPRYAGPVKGGGGGCAAAHLPGFAGPSRARGWKRGQAPRPAPARRTARRPRRGGRLRRPGRQGSSELAFDGQKKRRNYTNPGPGSRPGNLITAEPPGEAASHKTRCA